jgi:hypothetical protein
MSLKMPSGLYYDSKVEPIKFVPVCTDPAEFVRRVYPPDRVCLLSFGDYRVVFDEYLATGVHRFLTNALPILTRKANP